MELKQSHFFTLVSIAITLMIIFGSLLTWAISESRNVSLIEGRLRGSHEWIIKWMEERDKRIKNIESRLIILEKQVKKRN